MHARLVNRVVVEIMQPVPGFGIDQCYHPDILAQCVLAPVAVEPGWTVEEDGTIKNVDGVVVYTPPVETVAQGDANGGQVDSGSNQEAGVTQEATGGTSGQEDSVQGAQQGS